MKRIVISLTVLVVLALAAIFSEAGSQRVTRELQIKQEQHNPWTHLELNNRRKNFQFVIVSDRTGDHWPGVFASAIDKINLLQPEFVISVGDLIEGSTEDRTQLKTEWSEFDGMVQKLKMPFFYVPGNHDITNQVMKEHWDGKFGRSYYWFRFHNVLFLCLNTEDPPDQGLYNISLEQQTWAKTVLEQNKNVRWTCMFLHKPVWDYDEDHFKKGWVAVEQSLQGRKYTVFSGHHHRYKRFERFGREYYMLASTGGASKLRGKQKGEFDHVVWVTMKDSGPVLANLLLDGIEDKFIGQKP